MSELTPGDPLGSDSRKFEAPERPPRSSPPVPAQGAPGGNPPSGKKLGWKAWAAIIFAGLVVLGAVFGEDESTEQADTSESTAQQASDTATPEPTAEPTPVPTVSVKVAKPSS